MRCVDHTHRQSPKLTRADMVITRESMLRHKHFECLIRLNFEVNTKVINNDYNINIQCKHLWSWFVRMEWISCSLCATEKLCGRRFMQIEHHKLYNKHWFNFVFPTIDLLCRSFLLVPIFIWIQNKRNVNRRIQILADFQMKMQLNRSSNNLRFCWYWIHLIDYLHMLWMSFFVVVVELIVLGDL